MLAGYGPGHPGASGGVTPPRGLSLASFITGIGSVLIALLPLLGILAGIAAVVLGFLGRSKERGAPRWMWLTGIITGFVGIVISVLTIVAAALLYLNAGPMG